MEFATGKKNSIGIRSLLFLSLALLSLLAAPAHAAAVTCGQTFEGSGTCTGGTNSFSCSTLTQNGIGCCEEAGCQWSTSPDQDTCKGGTRTVTCSGYNDNPQGCNAMGCKFNMNAGAGSCGGSVGGKGYGVACNSTSDCAKCLVCDPVSSKCTQKPGICTTIPAEYVPQAPPLDQPGTGITPQSAIGNLESGTTGGMGGAVVGSGTNIYNAGWFSDWKAMGFIGVAIVCSIIALAAMIGIAFNMPEVRAFANTELRQAVISVLLIVSLIAMVTFFNEIAHDAVYAAGLPVACNNGEPYNGEPCYATAAKAYLGQIYDTGNEYAQTELRESIVNAKRASYGYNLNLNKIYLLFAGMSIRFNAGDTLVAERHGALFTQAAKMMSSIYSQKYFIDVITFGVAPLFILLGIVLRTFFFTRKLGGLLLAMAISLFIIYPLTYAFAWYTLNVTVYGERTLAVADPNCPGECTGTYPVAFFTSSTGELVQFSTMQSIMRAGINAANWPNGGPGGAFPGLVACRDLAAINLPSSVAPNSCPGCPDYCRDVPFPSGIPGCNITQCSACNAGCKIVRQRLDCQTDPSCAGNCPLSCRTRVPLENKCFSNEAGGIIPANLAISCSGCGKYPAWCRFLKNESGVLTRVYNDPNKDMACARIDSDPTCPQQCSYVTSMGKDLTCDSLCSDPISDTVCPKECRVNELLNSPSWASTYDLAPPNLTSACRETPQIAAACSACANHPECLVTAGAITGCSKYPTISNGSELCLDCPDYCRRTAANFNVVFSSLSNAERSASNFPDVCVPTQTNNINCSASGNPPACALNCSVNASLNTPPQLCRPLQTLPSADKTLCGACPDETRYSLRFNKSGICPGGGSSTQNDSGNNNITTGAPAGGYDVVFFPSGNKMASGAPGKIAGTLWLAGGASVNTISARIDPPNPSNTSNPAGFCNGTGDDGQGSGGAAPADGSIQFQAPTIRLAAMNIKYEYKWYLDGVQNSSGQTAGSFPSGIEAYVSNPSGPVAVGQNWTFSCRAFSGAISGSWKNASVVIQAQNPSMVSSRISAAVPPATAASTLVGYCNGTDSGGAPLLYNYTYYLNGVANSTGQTSSAPSGTEVAAPTNIQPPLAAGQSWSFSCNAYNGSAYSGWLNSTPLTIQGPLPEPNCTVTIVPVLLQSQYDCGPPACNDSCMGPIVELPNPSNSPCEDANLTGCPYGCRVKGAGADYLNGSCAAACAGLPAECFVDPTVPAPAPWPICSEYLGNGPKTCHSTDCIGLNATTCESPGTGCAWDGLLCDKAACTAKPSQASCTGTAGCVWMYTAKYVPINDRQEPYKDRTACRQCPEECRLAGYTGSCGVTGNSDGKYVDCSESECPPTCRVPKPSPTSTPAYDNCQPYPEGNYTACQGCPALCRRQSDISISSCSSYPNCAVGDSPTSCTGDCLLENPPEKACEGCLACDYDCIYYPSIRTDCSSICSDEALAGPVNIEPNDFIKSLPGAKTAYVETKNIGTLYLPAVVLPLFCIVIVIAFIRVLSPILGGDIEIPGLGRII